MDAADARADAIDVLMLRALTARQHNRLVHLRSLDRVVRKIEEIEGHADDESKESLDYFLGKRQELVQIINHFSYIVVYCDRDLELALNYFFEKPVYVPVGTMQGLALSQRAFRSKLGLISSAEAEAADAAEAAEAAGAYAAEEADAPEEAADPADVPEEAAAPADAPEKAQSSVVLRRGFTDS